MTDRMQADLFDILTRAEDRLTSFRGMGLYYVPPKPASESNPAGSMEKSTMPNSRKKTDPVKPQKKQATPNSPQIASIDLTELNEMPEPPADRGAALNKLAEEIGACKKCKLYENRTNPVPGEGDPKARVVFVGEGPGYHEDQQGRPFVGRAGQLLEKMILAMGFQREDVFICNVVKCRPPENRDPLPDEIEQCEPYLKRQLEIIQPKVIVGLGRHAVQTLLKTKTTIGRLRGNWHAYHTIPFMPTFHPAYLLRNPKEKRSCWEDLQKVMAQLKENEEGR